MLRWGVLRRRGSLAHTHTHNGLTPTLNPSSLIHVSLELLPSLPHTISACSYNFLLHVPYQLERLIGFGSLLLVDSFLVRGRAGPRQGGGLS